MQKVRKKINDMIDRSGGIIKSSMPSIISANMYIEGSLKSFGCIEVEGKINGSIISRSIIIREKGSCEGTISANSIDIQGSFSGDLDVNNIKVSKKAVVTGKFSYNSLIVEDGASIEGEFKKREVKEKKENE
ncbi:MAG: cytoskeletal protein CcmA (bactofilin family) [Rickettsiales bacterium]|jgi:cytoskeletal protein CcmA (bactofilin family)